MEIDNEMDALLNMVNAKQNEKKEQEKKEQVERERLEKAIENNDIEYLKNNKPIQKTKTYDINGESYTLVYDKKNAYLKKQANFKSAVVTDVIIVGATIVTGCLYGVIPSMNALKEVSGCTALLGVLAGMLAVPYTKDEFKQMIQAKKDYIEARKENFRSR